MVLRVYLSRIHRDTRFTDVCMGVPCKSNMAATRTPAETAPTTKSNKYACVTPYFFQNNEQIQDITLKLVFCCLKFDQSHFFQYGCHEMYSHFLGRSLMGYVIISYISDFLEQLSQTYSFYKVKIYTVIYSIWPLSAMQRN